MLSYAIKELTLQQSQYLVVTPVSQEPEDGAEVEVLPLLYFAQH